MRYIRKCSRLIKWLRKPTLVYVKIWIFQHKFYYCYYFIFLNNSFDIVSARNILYLKLTHVHIELHAMVSNLQLVYIDIYTYT